MRVTSSSVRADTLVFGSRSRSAHSFCAVGLPIPKMYVREISNRFSRGMSIPAMRAISVPVVPSWVPSALALLVARVVADHHDATVPADDLALLAHLLDAGTNLHG